MIKTYHKSKSVNHVSRVIPAGAGIQIKITLSYLFQVFLKRKIMLVSIMFLIITLPIFFLVTKYKSKVEAAWMDDNYKSDCAFSGRGTSGFFVEGNVDQKKNHQKQTVQKNNIISQFAKINSNHSFFASSLRYLAIINEKIPEINFNVKTKKSPIVVIGLSLGSMKTTTNQAAAILTNSSDSISNQASEIIVYQLLI